MEFKDILNGLLKEVDGSAREISELSGISETTISRYRTGERRPDAKGKNLEALATAFATIAKKKKIKLSKKELLKRLSQGLVEPYNYQSIQQNFNLLMERLEIRVAEISRALKYDPSHISRIRNGQRRPAEPERFVDEVSQYVVRNFEDDTSKNILAGLMSVKISLIQSREMYYRYLSHWLLSDSGEVLDKSSTEFLTKMDDFNLLDYVHTNPFDDMKFPTTPFQLHGAKNYYGIEDMKSAELDFLRATILSKSKTQVFMFSDMRLDDMAADDEFYKKYLLGLALLLKKGHRIDIIHNVNRPINEMMIGLEMWIPLYMTGQIRPYYLKGIHNRIFSRSLNVSGVAALAGESLTGFHEDGKAYLTKNKTELAYYQKRAEDILSSAKPLLEIFTKETEPKLWNRYHELAKEGGKLRHMFTTLPIYTISEVLLDEILHANAIPEDFITKVHHYLKRRREVFGVFLQQNVVYDSVPVLSEEEFKEYPLSLELTGFFYEKPIRYSYEQYLKHLKECRAFEEENENYVLVERKKPEFKNLQITMMQDQFVVVTKSQSPAIHFLVEYAPLREAIEDMFERTRQIQIEMQDKL